MGSGQRDLATGSSLSDAEYFGSLSEEDLSLLHDRSYRDYASCFACSSTLHITLLSRHPLLAVPICNPCKQFYSSQPWKPGTGAFDRCRACAINSHPLKTCKEPSCNNTFCSRCIEKNVGVILNKTAWTCFACDTMQIQHARAKYFDIFNYWREQHDVKLYSDPISRYFTSAREGHSVYSSAFFWEYEKWKNKLETEPRPSKSALCKARNKLLLLYEQQTQTQAEILNKLRKDLKIQDNPVSSESEEEEKKKESTKNGHESEKEKAGNVTDRSRSSSPNDDVVKEGSSHDNTINDNSISSSLQECVNELNYPDGSPEENEETPQETCNEGKTSPLRSPSPPNQASPDRSPSTPNQASPDRSLSTPKKTSPDISPSTLKKTSADISPSTSKKASPDRSPSTSKRTSPDRSPSTSKNVSLVKSSSTPKVKKPKHASSSLLQEKKSSKNELYKAECSVVLTTLRHSILSEIKEKGYALMRTSKSTDSEKAAISRLCNLSRLHSSASSSKGSLKKSRLSRKKETVEEEKECIIVEDQTDIELEDSDDEDYEILNMSKNRSKKVAGISSSEDNEISFGSSDDEEGEREKSSNSYSRASKKGVKTSSEDGEDRNEEKKTKLKLPSFMTMKLNEKTSTASSSSSIKSIPQEKSKKKRKRITRLTNSSDSSKENSSSSSEASERRGKKRKKRNDSSESDSKLNESPSKGRKDIRKIIKSSALSEMSKEAAEIELERRKRIQERLELYEKDFAQNTQSSEPLKELVLDFNPKTKEIRVEVDKDLVKAFKPHQANGVKFMWDSVFESKDDVLSSRMPGGAILAHCMGLGKTLQTIALIHTVLNSFPEHITKALVICPVNTVKNWKNEFEKWCGSDSLSLDVYELSEERDNTSRAYLAGHWKREGGVLIIGYDMYRNLTQRLAKRLKSKQKEVFYEALVNPGPDLVVCDEGHILKNRKSALNNALTQIKTKRRILLTGTPLQNNLSEYFAMVDFVKPNLLGTFKEFKNRFVNPIQNGQHSDSTDRDVRVMKKRSFILSDLLKGCLQRLDYSVLVPFLQPKHEYVLCINLTDLQKKLYKFYLDNFAKAGVIDSYGKMEGWKKGGLFNDVSTLSQIWNHPIVLSMAKERRDYNKMMKDDEDDLSDFVEDGSIASSPEEESSKDSEIEEIKEQKRTRSCKDNELSEDSEPTGEQGWWSQHLESEEDLEDIRHSSKILILLEILRSAELLGDKTLVFSQSLLSLNMIEEFLRKLNEYHNGRDSEGVPESLRPFVGPWTQGVNYYRLDGSTSPATRQKWCNYFNKPSNIDMKLFLISTKAGGLGINLVSANRVIIFDASWNPAHDMQSIFRVYRFGQIKPVYIYRFLAKGTMEEKIYDRQVTKQSLSARVVDEQQIERHFSVNELSELYKYNDQEQSERPVPKVPGDEVLAEILAKYPEKIWKFHDHDSLLENKVDENLTEAERKAAWEEYENEKKGVIDNMGIMQSSTVSASNKNYLFTPDINFLQIQKAYRLQNPTFSNEQILMATRQYIYQLQKAHLANQMGAQLSNQSPNEPPQAQPPQTQKTKPITEILLVDDSTPEK